MQNQIATELANLAQFHAKCKSGQMEVVVQTLSLAHGVDAAVLQQRNAAIQQITRSGYCKERSLVEEEITTRQEQLIAVAAQKQQTKGEETI